MKKINEGQAGAAEEVRAGADQQIEKGAETGVDRQTEKGAETGVVIQTAKTVPAGAAIEIAKAAREVMDRIEEAGHDAYAVGGSVRDALLGRAPYDWDLATSASAETIMSLFPRAAKTGIKFGIVKVFHEGMTIDVATYRKDGPYEDCRRPCHVDFTPNLEEDLKRRDFTMNAMAFSPTRGLKDPFKGQEDLAKKLIRTVGDPFERFKEDALRILRAVRFAGQLNFEIDKASQLAMKSKAELLAMISVERIREEFEKTMISTNPAKSLALCLNLGLFPYILGEPFRTIEGDEKQKLLALIDVIDSSNRERDLRLSLLFLCFDTEKVMKAIDRLKFDNLTKTKLKSIKYLVADLPLIQSKEALKKFISRNGFENYYFTEEVINQQALVMNSSAAAAQLAVKPRAAKVEPAIKSSDAATVWPAAKSRADVNAQTLIKSGDAAQIRQAWLDEILANKEPVFLADLAVNGNDLIKAGVAKGANVGKVLFFLLDHVQLFPLDNETDLLMAKASEFKLHNIK